jgi:uncharacterized membrane protein YkgB
MMNKFFRYTAGLQNIGVHIARWGMVIVLLWMGSLIALKNEPYGTVPFVTHNPNADFISVNEAPKYTHANNETNYKPGTIAWLHAHDNGTFSYGIGALMILIGVMIALYPVRPGVSAVGSFLAFIISLVTLLSLITIPQTGATLYGDTEYEFPYLSTAGRYIVEDFIMLGASIATMAQAAEAHLKKQRNLSYSV